MRRSESATLIEVSFAELKVALKISLIIWLLPVIAISASAATSTAAAGGSSLVVRWEPYHLVNGSPILFQVRSPSRLEKISARWMEHDLFFSYEASKKIWFAIAGVSLETRPGKYSLVLTARTNKNEEILVTRQVAIIRGKYRRISVNVPKQFTEPSTDQVMEIKQEKALKQELFSRMDPKRQWEGDFVAPVAATVSDVFGTTREFNGKTLSMHQGLDYAVPTGTPVAALNRGTVWLARSLFFEGNCVVLDHGQGLLSLYMHLSRLDVKEGETVEKGQDIGLSGGTGRATGPHLHIAVRWQGVYVNPATLLSLKLP